MPETAMPETNGRWCLKSRWPAKGQPPAFPEGTASFAAPPRQGFSRIRRALLPRVF